jgi:hypothetical protein
MVMVKGISIAVMDMHTATELLEMVCSMQSDLGLWNKDTRRLEVSKAAAPAEQSSPRYWQP